jgi:hypothetical protein
LGNIAYTERMEKKKKIINEERKEKIEKLSRNARNSVIVLEEL